MIFLGERQKKFINLCIQSEAIERFLYVRGNKTKLRTIKKKMAMHLKYMSFDQIKDVCIFISDKYKPPSDLEVKERLKKAKEMPQFNWYNRSND